MERTGAIAGVLIGGYHATAGQEDRGNREGVTNGVQIERTGRPGVVAERIRSDFKAVEFEPDGTMVTKTLSAGIAQFSDTDDVSALIKKADKAMYYAKQLGKDQVSVYTDIVSGEDA